MERADHMAGGDGERGHQSGFSDAQPHAVARPAKRRWMDRPWLPAVLTGAIVAGALVQARQVDVDSRSEATSPAQSLGLVSLETAWRAVRPAPGPVAPLVAEHAPVGVPSRLPASRRPYLRAPRDFAAPVPTAALPDPLGREAAARTETPLRRLSDSNAEESRADSTLHPLVKEPTAGTPPVKAKAQRKASASTARASGPRASAGPKGPVFSHRPRAQPRREAPLDDLASLIEPPSPTIQKVSLQSP